jgi:type IV pilus assembly protein PilA
MLLVTAAIGILSFGIVVIVLKVAIPSFLNLRKQANENSAMQSLRTIHQAEVLYNSTYPAQGFACDLKVLGGKGSGAAPNAHSAQLLPDDLAGGQKSGYKFLLVNCVKVSANGQGMFTSYQAAAVPEVVGKTGNRGFCMDITGELSSDPDGGTACLKSIQ